MSYAMLEQHNSWWSGDIKDDPDFRKWRASKIKWIPKIVNEISLKLFSLHILIGPRQVGKTTALKLLIKRLLDEGRNPYSIVYLNCDMVENSRSSSIFSSFT